MSMAFHVILRRKPQRDLGEQTEWLKRTRSIAAADRWRASLIATPLPNLESDPCRYPQAYLMRALFQFMPKKEFSRLIDKIFVRDVTV